MKRLVLIFSALAVLASCANNNGYTIHGVIEGDGVNDKAIYLSNMDRSAPLKDTATIVNGKFTFKGNIEHPEMCFISVEGIQERISIFLENDKYSIDAKVGEFQKAEIKGGESQAILDEFMTLQKELKESIGDFDKLIEEYRNPATSDERKEEIIGRYEEFNDKTQELKDSILAANPNSYLALSTFKEEMYDMEFDELKAKLAVVKANPKFASHKDIKVIESFVVKEESLQVGMIAPDFTLNDTNGNPVKLSDIYPKGKITMIDFWAGWCNPCRNFNPTLVKIYKKYHKKGFEILGVSLDRDREQWLDAIKTDKLTWTQVSELKFWNSSVVDLYNVRYIPQNIFVDSEGKIVGRRVSEDDIEELLEEYCTNSK